MDYFLARYYSGAQGRFLSPDEWKGGIVDPITGQDIETNIALPYADITGPRTLNKYAYVRNNPLRFIDPDGHLDAEHHTSITKDAAESFGYTDEAINMMVKGNIATDAPANFTNNREHGMRNGEVKLDRISSG